MIEMLNFLIGKDIIRITYYRFYASRGLVLYFEDVHLLNTGFHEDLLTKYFKDKINYI